MTEMNKVENAIIRMNNDTGEIKIITDHPIEADELKSEYEALVASNTDDAVVFETAIVNYDAVCSCDSNNTCFWICFKCRQFHCMDCDGEVLESVDGNNCCSACLEAILAEPATKKWIEDCVAKVRITGDIEVYDARYRYAPTPKEYYWGQREAYTENSVHTFNRHHRTNYDALIKDLDRFDAVHSACYDAIRDRVEELLYEAKNADQSSAIVDDDAFNEEEYEEYEVREGSIRYTVSSSPLKPSGDPS
jgi:hypothetical protein